VAEQARSQRGMKAWVEEAGGRVRASWIFIHGTDIVDRGFIVLFFRSFFRCPLPWKRLNSAIFDLFLLYSIFYQLAP